MTTIAKLLAQKQRLLERLQEDPGPHVREEIDRLLAEIDAELNQLDEMAERDAIGVQMITDAFKERSARRSCGCLRRGTGGWRWGLVDCRRSRCSARSGITRNVRSVPRSPREYSNRHEER